MSTPPKISAPSRDDAAPPKQRRAQTPRRVSNNHTKTSPGVDASLGPPAAPTLISDTTSTLAPADANTSKMSPSAVPPPAAKRNRKNQHSVSFGSPLSQPITLSSRGSPQNSPNAITGTATANSEDKGRGATNGTGRGRHRRQASSTSSSQGVNTSTSAQQLALIQQRYAADQHAAQQQIILQQQLGTSPGSVLGRRSKRVIGSGVVGSGALASAEVIGFLRSPSFARTMCHVI
jgi:hypothetical protein